MSGRVLLLSLWSAIAALYWLSPGTNWQASVLLALVVGLAFPRSAVRNTQVGPDPAELKCYLLSGICLIPAGLVFRGNEFAGALLLFAPLAAALAGCNSLPTFRRFQAGLLTAIFCSCILLSGSRGGQLAFAFGVFLQLIVLKKWKALGVGIVLAAALAWSQGFDWWLFDGKVQGLSLASLLTGRPEIWYRSIQAAIDFAWTGVGFGSFAEVVALLYFPRESASLLHAHNFFLQAVLDFGILGLFGILCLASFGGIRVVAAAKRGATHGRDRAIATGLMGSLFAFLIFGLADTVRLYGPGGLAFAFLVRLVFSLEPTSATSRLARWLPLILGSLVVAAGWLGSRPALNAAAVTGVRALVSEPREVGKALSRVAQRGSCRAGWLGGKLAQVTGDSREMERTWAELIQCSGSFVTMIAKEQPTNRKLAEVAVREQPGPDALFWLARIERSERRIATSEALYRRGLAIAPGRGRAWLELGGLVASIDPVGALLAYGRGCENGDPGANSCLAAGSIAEQLGDRETARFYYGKSRFRLARERAADLEREAKDRGSGEN